MRTALVRWAVAAVSVVAAFAASACGERVSLGELAAASSPADGSMDHGDTGSIPLDAASAADGSLDAHVEDAGPFDAGSYVPCANKACGEACTLCRPSDPQCFETAVPKQCDSAGTCQVTAPVCHALDGGGAYDPCAGKACGDGCKLCPPGDPGCFEPAIVKQCNSAGKCSTAPLTC